MATFKNVSDMEQTVDGVGLVKPGETCEIIDENFNNPNFEKVKETKHERTERHEREEK